MPSANYSLSDARGRIELGGDHPPVDPDVRARLELGLPPLPTMTEDDDDAV